MNLTDAQERVLALLSSIGGDWAHLRWLDNTPLLQEDDFITVPSLIENGWADYRLRSIRITESGLSVLARAKDPARAEQPSPRMIPRRKG